MYSDSTADRPVVNEYLESLASSCLPRLSATLICRFEIFPNSQKLTGLMSGLHSEM